MSDFSKRKEKWRFQGKKLFTFIAFSLCIVQCYSQADRVTNLKMYLVNWNARYLIVPNIDNFKRVYCYRYETKENNLEEMFSGYSDCVNKLLSQDTVYQKYNSCSARVELFFGSIKVILFFNNSGDYYFKGKWHKINSGLYYLLFSNFSDKIMPIKTLNDAKLKMKSEFWNENE